MTGKKHNFIKHVIGARHKAECFHVCYLILTSKQSHIVDIITSSFLDGKAEA